MRLCFPIGCFLLIALTAPLSAHSADATLKKIRHAAGMLSNGRPLKAYSELKGILAANPNNEDAKLLMAVTLTRISAEADSTGNRAQIIEQLRAALRLDPGAAYTHRDLAKALYLEGHKEEAVKECQQAAKLSPDDSGLAGGCGLGVASDRPAPEFVGLAPIETQVPKKTRLQLHDREPWFRSIPDPEYSPKAREVGLRGSCVIVATVSANGDVAEAAIVKPIGLGLDQIALRTVRTWKFHPSLVHGLPIPARVLLKTSFHVS